MVAVIVVVASVLALLLYSGFQLYTSRWENEGGRVDRVQMFLIFLLLLDLPCVFLPFRLQYDCSLRTVMTVAILSGTVPFVIGAWVANRKGPARTSIPTASLILFLSEAFDYSFFAGWWSLGGKW